MRQRDFQWHAHHDRPGRRVRVLVENPSTALEVSDFTAYQEAGLDVALCSGPTGPGDECPLMTSGQCSLVEDADVVYFALPDEGDGRALIEGLERSYPTTPVVIEVPRDRLELLDGVPASWVTLFFPASVQAQINALRQATSTSSVLAAETNGT